MFQFALIFLQNTYFFTFLRKLNLTQSPIPRNVPRTCECFVSVETPQWRDNDVIWTQSGVDYTLGATRCIMGGKASGAPALALLGSDERDGAS